MRSGQDNEDEGGRGPFLRAVSWAGSHELGMLLALAAIALAVVLIITTP